MFVDGSAFLLLEGPSGSGVSSLLPCPSCDSGALRRLVEGGGI